MDVPTLPLDCIGILGARQRDPQVLRMRTWGGPVIHWPISALGITSALPGGRGSTTVDFQAIPDPNLNRHRHPGHGSSWPMAAHGHWQLIIIIFCQCDIDIDALKFAFKKIPKARNPPCGGAPILHTPLAGFPCRRRLGPSDTPSYFSAKNHDRSVVVPVQVVQD